MYSSLSQFSVIDNLFILCFSQEQKFLHSFEDNSDYIYDVKWSPTHPALFASADGNGKLDLWNLNNDTEVSVSPQPKP